MSRTDDIINVAGHRLSTGAMEEVLASHPDVAECAVLGVADETKGEIPLGLIVLKAGVERPHDQIVSQLIRMVRERIGPVASFKVATTVQTLPNLRTRTTARDLLHCPCRLRVAGDSPLSHVLSLPRDAAKRGRCRCVGTPGW